MKIINYAQLGFAFSKSLISYKLNLEPHPFSASFVVTNQCNIHCNYCNFPNLKDRNLDLNEIDIIFSKLKKMGVKRLGLLGGEPLYRNDIIEIIDLAKNYNFFISLNSNLLMYNKFKNQLQNVDYFFTSIDGRPETHIKNRGMQSFDKIINSIEDIRDKGKTVTAICVINNQEKEDIDYLIELSNRLNIQVHFQPECYETDIVRNSHIENIDKNNLLYIWSYILKLKQNKAPIASSEIYIKKIIEWDNYNVSAFLEDKSRCSAGRGFLFVDSSGKAFPCAYTKGKVDGISLLDKNWEDSFQKATPCTTCIVGPMLEFNLLFDHPVKNSINVFKQYL